MRTMTVEPHKDTRPEVASYTRPEVGTYALPTGIQELDTNPRLEEVLGWFALAGFAVACYLVFALAIWA